MVIVGGAEGGLCPVAMPLGLTMCCYQGRLDDHDLSCSKVKHVKCGVMSLWSHAATRHTSSMPVTASKFLPVTRQYTMMMHLPRAHNPSNGYVYARGVRGSI